MLLAPRRILALIVVVFSVLAVPRRGVAGDGGSVVVIARDPAFRHAVSVALAAWDLRVVGVDVAVPSSTMPRAGREARAIAQRHSAIGLVWIGTTDEEHALYVYDVENDQVVSRTVTGGPPFDAPTAAAAALSVKTLLRSSAIAPPGERIGASAPPIATTHEREPVPPPALHEPEPAPAASAPGIEALPVVRVETSGAARVIADDVDTRVGLGASVWLGKGRTFGLGIVVRGGPGLGIEDPRFRGRFDEITASPSMRLRVPLRTRFVLEPRVGGTFHATTIDGVTVASARPANVSRIDASADLGVVFDVAVARAMSIGLDVEASTVLRWQRYLVEDATVFELRPVQGSFGLRLAMGLP